MRRQAVIWGGGGVGVLLLVFLVSITSTVYAQGAQATQEGMCVLPTGTEVVQESQGWSSTVVLRVGVNTADLDQEGRLPVGECASVWVESNGFGKPLYNLEITGGDNFYFAGAEQEATTMRDFEQVDLCAESNACGSVEISVTDARGALGTAHLRTDNGTWASEVIDCQMGEFQNWNAWAENVEGDTRYVVRYYGYGTDNLTYCGFEGTPYYDKCNDSCAGWLSDPHYSEAIPGAICDWWYNYEGEYYVYIATTADHILPFVVTKVSNSKWECP